MPADAAGDVVMDLPAGGFHVKRRGAAAAWIAVLLASAALFAVSKGRWSDVLIDSGREWIVPDALSSGRLLYRDVVYWFGPFTPYFQAAFLRAFGSGFAALVLAGAAAAVAILAVFHSVVRRVAGNRTAFAWTALAIPALVFMPNAGGALLGMGYRIWHAAGFALAAVALASRPPGRYRVLAALGAGVCAAAAGLCRTEWGLAAAAAIALASVARARQKRDGIRFAALGLAAWAAVFAAGLGFFVWRAGSGAVLGDGHVLLTGLPPETRHFLVAFSGLPDWRRGSLEMLYSCAMWAGLFVLAAWFGWPRSVGRPRGLAAGLVVLLAVLGLTAALGGAGSAVLFSAAPLVCAAGLVVGWRRRGGSAAAALAASGFLGALMSYRRPFHIGDSAYVGPPLLFAFVCAAGLLHVAAASRRRREERVGLETAFGRAAGVLVVAAFAARAWQYASIEAAPIAGTSGMLTARPERAREIEELAAAVRRQTPDGGGLAVFPEGELLNLLASRRNPIRHKLYLPGYLTAGNESDVLAELERARPDAVVLWRRPVSEYDRAMFGEDYGMRVRAWIDAHYDLAPFRAAGAPPRANPAFVLGLRRP
jgi:hypothetical protein